MDIREGYEIVWDEKAPKGRRIVKVGQGRQAEVTQPKPVETDAPKPRRGRPPKVR